MGLTIAASSAGRSAQPSVTQLAAQLSTDPASAAAGLRTLTHLSRLNATDPVTAQKLLHAGVPRLLTRAIARAARTAPQQAEASHETLSRPSAPLSEPRASAAAWQRNATQTEAERIAELIARYEADAEARTAAASGRTQAASGGTQAGGGSDSDNGGDRDTGRAVGAHLDVAAGGALATAPAASAASAAGAAAPVGGGAGGAASAPSPGASASSPEAASENALSWAEAPLCGNASLAVSQLSAANPALRQAFVDAGTMLALRTTLLIGALPPPSLFVIMWSI